MRRTTVAAVTSLLVLAGAEPGSAQVELALHGGIYIPLADLVVREVPGFGSTPAKELGWRQRTAAAVGGRVTVWLSRRLGLEAAALFTPSNLARDLELGPPVETGTNITAATGRVVWRLGDPDRPVTYHLLAGIGFAARSGPAFDNSPWDASRHIAGTTDLAVVVGGGLRAKLSPRVDLRLDVDDYAYSPEVVMVFTDPAPDGTVMRFERAFDTELVNDLVVSLGLAFEL
jgi:hypothetical protein